MAQGDAQQRVADRTRCLDVALTLTLRTWAKFSRTSTGLAEAPIEPAAWVTLRPRTTAGAVAKVRLGQARQALMTHKIGVPTQAPRKPAAGLIDTPSNSETATDIPPAGGDARLPQNRVPQRVVGSKRQVQPTGGPDPVSSCLPMLPGTGAFRIPSCKAPLPL